jgi:hypothetical protein
MRNIIRLSELYGIHQLINNAVVVECVCRRRCRVVSAMVLFEFFSSFFFTYFCISYLLLVYFFSFINYIFRNFCAIVLIIMSQPIHPLTYLFSDMYQATILTLIDTKRSKESLIFERYLYYLDYIGIKCTSYCCKNGKSNAAGCKGLLHEAGNVIRIARQHYENCAPTYRIYG